MLGAQRLTPQERTSFNDCVSACRSMRTALRRELPSNHGNRDNSGTFDTAHSNGDSDTRPALTRGRSLMSHHEGQFERASERCLPLNSGHAFSDNWRSHGFPARAPAHQYGKGTRVPVSLPPRVALQGTAPGMERPRTGISSLVGHAASDPTISASSTSGFNTHGISLSVRPERETAALLDAPSTRGSVNVRDPGSTKAFRDTHATPAPSSSQGRAQARRASPTCSPEPTPSGLPYSPLTFSPEMPTVSSSFTLLQSHGHSIDSHSLRPTPTSEIGGLQSLSLDFHPRPQRALTPTYTPKKVGKEVLETTYRYMISWLGSWGSKKLEDMTGRTLNEQQETCKKILVMASLVLFLETCLFDPDLVKTCVPKDLSGGSEQGSFFVEEGGIQHRLSLDGGKALMSFCTLQRELVQRTLMYAVQQVRIHISEWEPRFLHVELTRFSGGLGLSLWSALDSAECRQASPPRGQGLPGQLDTIRRSD